jgi:hypothetical protein
MNFYEHVLFNEMVITTIYYVNLDFWHDKVFQSIFIDYDDADVAMDVLIRFCDYQLNAMVSFFPLLGFYA